MSPTCNNFSSFHIYFPNAQCIQYWVTWIFFLIAGIGRSVAAALASAGAYVIALDISPTDLNSLEEENQGKVTSVVADLSDWNQTRAALLPKLDKPLDGLVNNAGICIKEPFLLATENATYK